MKLKTVSVCCLCSVFGGSYDAGPCSRNRRALSSSAQMRFQPT